MNKCPECGGFEVDYGDSGTVCRNCGLVLDDTPIDINPYVSDISKNNASVPGMSSAGISEFDGRIVKNLWLMSTKQKNINLAKKQLGLLASKLKLPKVVKNEAFLIFRKAIDHEITIGRDNQSMLYASVYLACIIHGIPKTPLEIA